MLSILSLRVALHVIAMFGGHPPATLPLSTCTDATTHYHSARYEVFSNVRMIFSNLRPHLLPTLSSKFELVYLRYGYPTFPTSYDRHRHHPQHHDLSLAQARTAG